MRIKRFIAALLVCVMVFNFFPAAAFAKEAVFTISAADAQVEVGKQVSVDINLENNEGFSALNMYYTYNEQYFTLEKVVNKIPSFTMTSDKTTVWDSSVDYKADGVLATLIFSVAKDTPYGEYEIGLNLISAANADLQHVHPETVSATVTVTPIAVKGVSILNPDVKLDIGATEELKAVITPSDALNQSVTWHSKNEKIAKVDKNGVVTGVSYGSTEIVVTTNDGGYTASCKVSVNCSHSYDTQVILPTYQEHGYTIYTCSICKHTYNDNFVDPLDKISIDKADISLEYNSAFYKGKPLEPEVYVSYNGEKLNTAEELRVTYSQNNSVGTASVIVEGINRFTGTKTLTFKVSYEVIPETIVNVSAVSDFGKILISWGRASEVATTSYRIYRAVDGTDDFVLVTTVNGRDNVTYTDTSVEKGVSYIYYVTGVGAYGAESERSNVAGATALKDVTPPTILKVNPAENEILAGSVTFSTVADDNVGVTRAYYEYSIGGGEWKKIGYAENSSLSINYKINFSTDITDMRVRVTVYDAEGNKSEPKIVTYTVDNVGPDKVTGLTATALSSKLTLAWQDVKAADAKCFVLEQKTSSGWTVLANNITTLGYTVTGLTPDTTYRFRVVCVDAHGNKGTYSDEFSAKTLADTTAPTITEQGPSSARYNKEIRFYATARDDSDIKYIYIEVSRDLSAWTQVDVKEYKTAENKQEYVCTIDLSNYTDGSLYVRAVAEDFSGNRSSTGISAPYSEYIVDKTAPSAPQSVTANGKNGYISIFWAMGVEADISTYTVYRSSTLNGEYLPVSSSLTAVNYHDTAVEADKTYYYKVKVCDSAGNISGFSSAVSAAMSDDTQKPEITGIGSTWGQRISPLVNSISISATDNNKLYSLLVEYCTSTDLEYKSLLVLENIDASYISQKITLPVNDLVDGDVLHIRISAVDAAGLSSGYAMTKFTFDSTAPTLSELNANVSDNKVNLTWQGAGEEDLAGFKVYCSVDGGEFSLLGSRTANTSGSYDFTDVIKLKKSAHLTYKVEAIDKLENAFSMAVEAEFVYVYKNTPPTAKFTAPPYMMEGSEEIFDASSSSDDISIVSYLWDFGDGTTSTDKKAIKKYADKGIYTVTFTVTDNGGLTDTQSITIEVKERETLGVLNVAVLDEHNNPVPYVPVYFDLGSETQRVVSTDGSGIATMKLSDGSHLIGMYANGYLPVKKEVVVLRNATRNVTLTTVKEDIVTGEFEITRMSFDEILAAGIDVYAPANRNVYSATMRVSYGSTPPLTFSYVRNDTEILDFNIFDYSGKPVEEYENEKGEHRSFGLQFIGNGGSGGSGGSGGGGGEEPSDIVAILDIPANASYLKEFFDVKLHIVNNASPDFTLERNTVTLNVPKGMTLMNSVGGDYLTSPTEEIVSIKGQETKTLSWVLRGDEAGEYNLSADFTGTLALFNAPVVTRFETKTPIKVYGLEGVTFRILTADKIYNETLYFNVELENNRPIDIYAPASGLTSRVKNVTEYVLNEKKDGNYYVQTHLLNVYIGDENGGQQYIPFTIDADCNIIVNVDVLSPGQKIVYEYVAYNAIDYDGVAYFAEAVAETFEGLSENVEVGSFEKKRYSFTDYSEKLDKILSGEDNETVRGYHHLLNNNDFYYSTSTGGYFAEYISRLYKSADIVLNFDFSHLTQNEERELIQQIILTILSDSSVIKQSQDLLMTKYSDVVEKMIETVMEGVAKKLQSSESSVDDIGDVASDLVRNRRELANIYLTEGSDAFIKELNKRLAGYTLGFAVDAVDYLNPSIESGCFSEVFGEFKAVMNVFFSKIAEGEREQYYYATLKKECDQVVSSTILYALRDSLIDQLNGELVEAIDLKKLPETATIMSLPDIGFGANLLAFQTVETMITQLENDMDNYYKNINKFLEFVDGMIIHSAEQILQKVFATAIGSTPYGIISAAFNIADAIFNFGDYVKQEDAFEIYNSLTDAFIKTHLESIESRNVNSDFYSMLYLRAICEMRLSGEAQFKKFMSDLIDGVYVTPIHEDLVLFYINLLSDEVYPTYEKWGDALQYSVVRPRDLIFNIESGSIEIPSAPIVTLDYDTLTTKQSFSKKYEYCFADGEWKTCDGGPIHFEVGSVPSILRVREAANGEHLAGKITSVKIFAQKELSKLIGIKFDGVNYIVENLSSQYFYEILFVDDLHDELDWSRAKMFAGSENVLKGISYKPYAVIRSCHNTLNGETVSKPLTLSVSAKLPLNLIIEGNGSVSQSGTNGCYYNHEEIDLIATPNGFEDFLGWYVNGNFVSGDRYYIAEMDDEMQITARFSGKSISGIDITNPPKKLTYYEGEALDLNGLELTVTFSDAAPVTYSLVSDSTVQSIAEHYTAYITSNTAGKSFVVINYGGHTAQVEIEIIHDTIQYTRTEATCGDEGVLVTYCNLCKEIINEEPIAPTGEHTFEWIVDSEATCGENGYKHQHCTKCDAVQSENTPIAPTGEHTFAWVVDSEPTCGENGYKHEECSVCKIKRSENTPITATGNHSYEWVIDREATCGEGGLKHEECSVCKTKRSQNTAIAATGNHTYDDDHDTICNVCGGVRAVTDIKISSLPNKLTYLEVKDALELGGGKLTITYADGTTLVIDMTADMISGFDNTKVGKQQLVVTYSGKTAGFEVEVIAKKLSSIEVSTAPTKTEYLEGKDKLDLTGGKLTLYYNNDTTKVIDLSSATISGFDNTIVGEATLTVTYGGKSTTFTVTIKAKSLASINVTKKPNKLTYIEGNTFDKTGIEVTAYYDNGTSEVVTGFTLSGYSSTVGTKTITVTYMDKTCEFTVEVEKKSLTRIEVSTLPSKLEFLESKDTLSLAGGKLTLYYNNDTSAVISLADATVSGFDNTVVGENTLTVTYGGKSTTFTVEIIAKTLTKVEVSTAPTKTEYLEGKDALDLTGGKLTLYYNNDTSAVIDLADATISGFDNTIVGETTLTVTYGGKSTTFTVVIKAKSITSVKVTKKPDKLTYIEGNAFDSTGMVVTVYYDNGTSETVTDYTLSGYTATPGTKTITVKYGGKSTTFKVDVKEKSVTSIEITKNPDKLTYLEGENFDSTGMTVTVYYDNGTNEVVTDYTVSGYTSTPGTKTLSITYGGKSATLSVTVKEKSITSIEIATKPNKLTYVESTALDDEGMSITVYYDNGTTDTVTTGWSSEYDFTSVGTATVTVTYGGKTASYNITVTAKTLSKIEITKKPSKLTYIEGDELDITGMVVTAHYDNDTSKIITSYSVSGYTATVGTKTITVAYEGKTATFTVTVKAKELVKIEITSKPDKLNYLEGENFDAAGMVITAYYNNGTSVVVTDYAVSGYTATAGTKTIKVTYGGKSATFTVTVNSKVPSAVTSDKYTVSGDSISKISTGTTVSTLLNGLSEKEHCKVYNGNSEVSGKSPIGTGMVVKIMDGNTVKSSYTVIVTGDTNGDGSTSVTDMIAIKAHLLKKTLLKGAYATAANTNGDSGISITDFIQVKAKILGKGTITAR